MRRARSPPPAPANRAGTSGAAGPGPGSEADAARKAIGRSPQAKKANLGPIGRFFQRLSPKKQQKQEQQQQAVDDKEGVIIIEDSPDKAASGLSGLPSGDAGPSQPSSQPSSAGQAKRPSRALFPGDGLAETGADAGRSDVPTIERGGGDLQNKGKGPTGADAPPATEPAAKPAEQPARGDAGPAGADAPPATEPAAQPAEQPARGDAGSAEPEGGRGRGSFATGKYDWKDPKVRLQQWEQIKEDYQFKPFKSWVVFDPKVAAMHCSICLNHRGGKHGGVNWTKVEGQQAIHLSRIREHATSETHVAALRAREQRSTMITFIDSAIDRQCPLVKSMLRTAYHIGLNNESIRNFPRLCALQAANGGTGMDVGGPYQSKEYGLKFLRIISEALDEILLEEVRASPVVTLVVDESTDRSVTHNLAIYVSYLTPANDVEIKFMQLEDIRGEATGEALFKLLASALQENEIDMAKVVCITTDGAAVMTGERKGLATRMKDVCPFAVSFHCVAHKLALAVSDLFSDIPELVQYDELLHKIHGLFKNSPGRRHGLEEVQELLGAEVLSILKPHKIRWLSRSGCVARVKKCYTALLGFTKTEQDKGTKGAAEIYERLANVSTLVLTYVLDDILEIVAQLSRCFQSNLLSYLDVKNVLESQLTLLRRFTYRKLDTGRTVQPSLGDATTKLINDLRASRGMWHEHQLKLKELAPGGLDVPWSGFNMEVYTSKKFISKVAEDLIDNLNYRFPETELGVAACLGVLNPMKIAQEVTSDAVREDYGKSEILQLGQWFGSERGGKPALLDKDKLLRQWEASLPLVCRGAQSELRKVVQRGKGELINARLFWKGYLPTLDGMSPDLAMLVRIMMVLQPASAEVERGFSTMNLIKTEERTLLSPGTLDVLMRVSLSGPPVAIQHQSRDSPPWQHFDEVVLPRCLSKWDKEQRMPQRSSHAPRPNRVKHQAKSWWVNE